MNVRPVIALVLILFLCSWMGCFGCSERMNELEEFAQQMEEAAEEMEKAGEEAGETGEEGLAGLGKAMEEMSKALNDGAEVEPVNFRALRDLLPEELSGMELADRGGESGGHPMLKMSQAHAEFRAEDGNGRVKLSIVDLGTLKGAAMFGYSWLMMDVDKESSRGYERTMEYEGYPAYQKFDRRDGDIGTCTMNVVVGERFIVTAEGSNVTMETVEEALEEVDLGDLEDMKDEGVTT